MTRSPNFILCTHRVEWDSFCMRGQTCGSASPNRRLSLFNIEQCGDDAGCLHVKLNIIWYCESSFFIRLISRYHSPIDRLTNTANTSTNAFIRSNENATCYLSDTFSFTPKSILNVCQLFLANHGWRAAQYGENNNKEAATIWYEMQHKTQIMLTYRHAVCDSFVDGRKWNCHIVCIIAFNEKLMRNSAHTHNALAFEWWAIFRFELCTNW